MIEKAIYKAGGRNLPHIDCYGLVSHMYKKDYNIDIIDFDYIDPNNPQNEKYFIESMNSPRWIKVEPKKGAVVALKVNGYISHCGYMVNDKEFIHIMKDSGVVRAKINSDKWKNRIVGYYTFGVIND